MTDPVGNNGSFSLELTYSAGSRLEAEAVCLAHSAIPGSRIAGRVGRHRSGQGYWNIKRRGWKLLLALPVVGLTIDCMTYHYLFLMVNHVFH